MKNAKRTFCFPKKYFLQALPPPLGLNILWEFDARTSVPLLLLPGLSLERLRLDFFLPAAIADRSSNTPSFVVGGGFFFVRPLDDLVAQSDTNNV